MNPFILIGIAAFAYETGKALKNSLTNKNSGAQNVNSEKEKPVQAENNDAKNNRNKSGDSNGIDRPSSGDSESVANPTKEKPITPEPMQEPETKPENGDENENDSTPA